MVDISDQRNSNLVSVIYFYAGDVGSVYFELRDDGRPNPTRRFISEVVSRTPLIIGLPPSPLLDATNATGESYWRVLVSPYGKDSVTLTVNSDEETRLASSQSATDTTLSCTTDNVADEDYTVTADTVFTMRACEAGSAQVSISFASSEAAEAYDSGRLALAFDAPKPENEALPGPALDDARFERVDASFGGALYRLKTQAPSLRFQFACVTDGSVPVLYWSDSAPTSVTDGTAVTTAITSDGASLANITGDHTFSDEQPAGRYYWVGFEQAINTFRNPEYQFSWAAGTVTGETISQVHNVEILEQPGVANLTAQPYERDGVLLKWGSWPYRVDWSSKDGYNPEALEYRQRRTTVACSEDLGIQWDPWRPLLGAEYRHSSSTPITGMVINDLKEGVQYDFQIRGVQATASDNASACVSVRAGDRPEPELIYIPESGTDRETFVRTQAVIDTSTADYLSTGGRWYAYVDVDQDTDLGETPSYYQWEVAYNNRQYYKIFENDLTALHYLYVAEEEFPNTPYYDEPLYYLSVRVRAMYRYTGKNLVDYSRWSDWLPIDVQDQHVLPDVSGWAAQRVVDDSGRNFVRLQWDNMTGASEYIVYLYDNGTFLQRHIISDQDHRDKDGVHYFVRTPEEIIEGTTEELRLTVAQVRGRANLANQALEGTPSPTYSNWSSQVTIDWTDGTTVEAPMLPAAASEEEADPTGVNSLMDDLGQFFLPGHVEGSAFAPLLWLVGSAVLAGGLGFVISRRTGWTVANLTVSGLVFILSWSVLGVAWGIYTNLGYAVAPVLPVALLGFLAFKRRTSTE